MLNQLHSNYPARMLPKCHSLNYPPMTLHEGIYQDPCSVLSLLSVTKLWALGDFVGPPGHAVYALLSSICEYNKSFNFACLSGHNFCYVRGCVTVSLKDPQRALLSHLQSNLHHYQFFKYSRLSFQSCILIGGER